MGVWVLTTDVQFMFAKVWFLMTANRFHIIIMSKNPKLETICATHIKKYTSYRAAVCSAL